MDSLKTYSVYPPCGGEGWVVMEEIAFGYESFTVQVLRRENETTQIVLVDLNSGISLCRFADSRVEDDQIVREIADEVDALIHLPGENGSLALRCAALSIDRLNEDLFEEPK